MKRICENALEEPYAYISLILSSVTMSSRLIAVLYTRSNFVVRKVDGEDSPQTRVLIKMAGILLHAWQFSRQRFPRVMKIFLKVVTVTEF